MKKSLIILGSAFLFAATAVAQDECVTSKCGAKVLPETGDWSIAVDAAPFIDFAADLVHIGAVRTANAPTWNSWNSPYVIVGKYFADDQTAYRGILAIRKYNEYETAQITKAEAIPLPATYFGDSVSFVEDSRSLKSGSLIIGGGYEKRKGHGRLQGSYGGEVVFSFEEGSREQFTYGNALTQNPTGNQPDVDPFNGYTTNFAGSNTYGGELEEIDQVTDARLLERKTGSTFGFGIRGFVGVEYFFAAKMSVGGEFGWGLGWLKAPKVSETWEAEGFLADGSEAAATYTDVDKTGVRKILSVNEMGVNNLTGMFGYIVPSANLRFAFYF